MLLHCLFLCVCISGLLKNSGITANPLPNQERVYLLTTATAPYCGVYEFVHIVIYQKSTLTDNVGINQCLGNALPKSYVIGLLC